jgi:hypothetical protein
MREHRLEPQVRTLNHPGQRAAQVVVPEPEAIHAGIDLQVIPDNRAMPRRGRLHRARGAGR